MSFAFSTRAFVVRFAKNIYEIVKSGIFAAMYVPSLGIEQRAQRLINLEIPVLVRSLKSNNVELGYYLDGRLFKCCPSAAANS